MSVISTQNISMYCNKCNFYDCRNCNPDPDSCNQCPCSTCVELPDGGGLSNFKEIVH